jgi:hypothetical protein
VLAKLSVLIVGLGILACLLLGLRQLRTQAAHEMAGVQKRVARHDRELWKIRSEIARRITPDKVALLVKDYGDLQPISDERYRVLVRLESLESGETTVTLGR